MKGASMASLTGRAIVIAMCIGQAYLTEAVVMCAKCYSLTSCPATEF